MAMKESARGGSEDEALRSLLRTYQRKPTKKRLQLAWWPGEKAALRAQLPWS